MDMGRLLGGRVTMSSPSRTTRPEVVSSKPATMRSVVVLPQPEGPRRVMNSPGAMSRLMRSTAVTSLPRLAKTFVTSHSWRWPAVAVSLMVLMVGSWWSFVVLVASGMARWSDRPAAVRLESAVRLRGVLFTVPLTASRPIRGPAGL